MCRIPRTQNAIGLWPDVGFAHLSTRTSSSATSLYVALSGARVRVADMVASGWATHYVPKDSLPQLCVTLTATALPDGGLQGALDAYNQPMYAPASDLPFCVHALSVMIQARG